MQISEVWRFGIGKSSYKTYRYNRHSKKNLTIWSKNQQRPEKAMTGRSPEFDIYRTAGSWAVRFL